MRGAARQGRTNRVSRCREHKLVFEGRSQNQNAAIGPQANSQAKAKPKPSQPNSKSNPGQRKGQRADTACLVPGDVPAGARRVRHQRAHRRARRPQPTRPRTHLPNTPSTAGFDRFGTTFVEPALSWRADLGLAVAEGDERVGVLVADARQQRQRPRVVLPRTTKTGQRASIPQKALRPEAIGSRSHSRAASSHNKQ